MRLVRSGVSSRKQYLERYTSTHNAGVDLNGTGYLGTPQSDVESSTHKPQSIVPTYTSEQKSRFDSFSMAALN